MGLSTSSVYPDAAPTAFELAARLGFDGVEIMVWGDAVSQNPDALARLSHHYAVPILALHAPCLLITARVWGRDPWGKLHRSADAAQRIAAATGQPPPVVVVHPAFIWQHAYAEGFVAGIAQLNRTTGVRFAVENMYPWRVGGRNVQAYAPSWNPVGHGYDHTTLDLSHAAVAGGDALEMLAALGSSLTHVHLADGTGARTDEHLVPGRGNQPCAAVLQALVQNSMCPDVVVEVNTRRATTATEREADLAASLTFARTYLQSTAVDSSAGPGVLHGDGLQGTGSAYRPS